MYNDDTRKKLRDIIEGVIIEKQKDHCTAARNFLCASFSSSTTVKKDFDRQSIIKKEQEQQLRDYCTANNFWTNAPDENKYLTRGGEALIYLAADNKHVLKLNDAVYYATWLEFFNSVLIHNTLFEQTRYVLVGFTEVDNTFMVVLQQPFIISDGIPDLEDVRKLLAYNGFENVKRNDFHNASLGLILEDIHDENVIINSNNLFFIDTVFYVDLDLKRQ